MGLRDRDRGLVLVGDLLYNAPILAGGIPSSSVADYRDSVLRLRAERDGARILSAHYTPEVAPAMLDDLMPLLDRALRLPRRARPITVLRHGRTTLIGGRRPPGDGATQPVTADTIPATARVIPTPTTIPISAIPTSGR